MSATLYTVSDTVSEYSRFPLSNATILVRHFVAAKVVGIALVTLGALAALVFIPGMPEALKYVCLGATGTIGIGAILYQYRQELDRLGIISRRNESAQTILRGIPEQNKPVAEWLTHEGTDQLLRSPEGVPDLF